MLTNLLANNGAHDNIQDVSIQNIWAAINKLKEAGSGDGTVEDYDDAIQDLWDSINGLKDRIGTSDYDETQNTAIENIWSEINTIKQNIEEIEDGDNGGGVHEDHCIPITVPEIEQILEEVFG
jgi:archaellum component FlaC